MKRNFIKENILKYAPDFCWMSAKDIWLMVSEHDEDISYECVQVSICRLFNEGKFLRKPVNNGYRERTLYLKIGG